MKHELDLLNTTMSNYKPLLADLKAFITESLIKEALHYYNVEI